MCCGSTRARCCGCTAPLEPGAAALWLHLSGRGARACCSAGRGDQPAERRDGDDALPALRAARDHADERRAPRQPAPLPPRPASAGRRRRRRWRSGVVADGHRARHRTLTSLLVADGSWWSLLDTVGVSGGRR